MEADRKAKADAEAATQHRTDAQALEGRRAPNRRPERAPSPADALAVRPDDGCDAGGPLLVPGSAARLAEPPKRSICARSTTTPTRP